MSKFKYQMDTQSKIGYARREGRKEGRLETARKLKAMGLPIKQIVQGTGLTEEQIGEL
jgi:predicted transposase/invertase (TIGR01784 family)